LANDFKPARSNGQPAAASKFVFNSLESKAVTSQKTNSPLKRADANQQFEVLRRRVSEQADGSSLRVTPAPQTVDFHRAFERNRGRFFFGYFLLLKQKKVTHR
jgi:hypothetical protein